MNDPMTERLKGIEETAPAPIADKQGGLRVLASGKFKSGKTLLVLSAAALGKLAVVDTEFVYHMYLQPHPNGNPKQFTPIPRVKALLGIVGDPVVVWTQTQDIGQATTFLEAAAGDAETVSIGLDSISVIWDLLTAQVEQRGDWGKVKRPLRDLQYVALNSRKHYIFTAHRHALFNKEMTQQTGEFPWSDKQDPHWALVSLKMEFLPGMSRPQAIIEGEASAGLFKIGEPLKVPTMAYLIEQFGHVPQLRGTALSVKEQDYRAQAAISAAGRREG